MFDEQGDGLGVRKEYDFSEGVRGRARVRSPKQRGAACRMAKSRQSDSIDDELTPSQIRELRRRMADFDDVTRYLLVSQMGPRFALYYNVSDDVYAMNNPRGATLFKRLKAALAVKALLYAPGRYPLWNHLIPCASPAPGRRLLPFLLPFCYHSARRGDRQRPCSPSAASARRGPP